VSVKTLEANGYLTAPWVLIVAAYGAFDQLSQGHQKVLHIINEQIASRKPSVRARKVQLGKSVSIAQARPDLQGNVGRPKNLTTAAKRKELDWAAGVNDTWEYILAKVEVLFPEWSKHHRQELAKKDYRLQGLGDFLCCGYALKAYSATAHWDADDPELTLGFRLHRLECETQSEFQLVCTIYFGE
jgi:hypothetical protein